MGGKAHHEGAEGHGPRLVRQAILTVTVGGAQVTAAQTFTVIFKKQ